MRERRPARLGSALFLLAGVMFLVAARVGGQAAFYGVAAAFAGVEGRSVPWERRGTRLFQVLFLLGIVGAVALGRRKQAVWPLVAPIFVVVLTVALTYGNQRFRAAAEPAVVVLGVAGAQALVGLARTTVRASRTAR